MKRVNKHASKQTSVITTKQISKQTNNETSKQKNNKQTKIWRKENKHNKETNRKRRIEK